MRWRNMQPDVAQRLVADEELLLWFRHVPWDYRLRNGTPCGRTSSAPLRPGRRGGRCEMSVTMGDARAACRCAATRAQSPIFSDHSGGRGAMVARRQPRLLVAVSPVARSPPVSAGPRTSAENWYQTQALSRGSRRMIALPLQARCACCLPGERGRMGRDHGSPATAKPRSSRRRGGAPTIADVADGGAAARR
jgi:hypothetical protein